jgi:hypothetical protein
MLALAKPGEVAQVALAVRARHMGRESLERINIQDIQEVTTSVRSTLLGETVGIVV